MAKCNQLTPLRFKGLSREGLSTGTVIIPTDVTAACMKAVSTSYIHTACVLLQGNGGQLGCEKYCCRQRGMYNDSEL